MSDQARDFIGSFSLQHSVVETEVPKLIVAAVEAGSQDPKEVADADCRRAGIELVETGNQFWMISWSLLFWECIFVRQYGSYQEQLSREFPSEQQDIPLDMFAPQFHSARSELLEARRRELEASGLVKPLERAYKTHGRKKTRLLEGIEQYDFKTMLRTFEKLPVVAALKIFDRLALDPSENRSGFPAWLAIGEGIAAIDFRSERGALKANQVDWLRYISGACEIPAVVVGANWTERKAKTTAAKVSGPKGTLVVSYGKSTSKSFVEVESIVDGWDEVSRAGEGSALIVSASLPLSRIAEALPVLEKIVRWKGATASIAGVEADIRAGGPLRCFGKKDVAWEGLDYCSRPGWQGADRHPLGCHLLSHPTINGDFSGHGVRDGQAGVFRVSVEKVAAELRAAVAELTVCPYFSEKKVEKFIENTPTEIDPRTMTGFGWRDDSGSTWIYERSNWVSGFSEDFPGIDRMLSAVTVSREDRREIVSRNREMQRVLRDIERPISAASGRGSGNARKKSGCLIFLVASVMGASVLVALVGAWL